MKRWIILLACMSLQSIETHALSNTSLRHLKLIHYEASAIQKPAEFKKEAPLPRHILILFFSNQCPHCISFAPILKEYATKNQWHIEAITLNEHSLPEFPHAIFATQEMIDVAYQGKPVVYPALFIANTTTKMLYPVSFGTLSYSELQERLSEVSIKVVEYEEHHP
jgi:type-F conjugative transfer system pilin assembly thiol-disulfide isomerase TrbB